MIAPSGDNCRASTICFSKWRSGSDARRMMKTPRNVLAAFALTACLASPAFAQKLDADVAVIVNVHNPLTSISMSDLYKVFSGEKQSWSASMPVFVVVRAPQARERDVLL